MVNLTLLLIWPNIKHILLIMRINSEYFSFQLLKTPLIRNLLMHRYLISVIEWYLHKSPMIMCTQTETHFERMLQRYGALVRWGFQIGVSDDLRRGLQNLLSVFLVMLCSYSLLIDNFYHVFTNFV
jgi:hypothetical protein